MNKYLVVSEFYLNDADKEEENGTARFVYDTYFEENEKDALRKVLYNTLHSNFPLFVEFQNDKCQLCTRAYKIDGRSLMDFGDAIKAIKNGHRVKR